MTMVGVKWLRSLLVLCLLVWSLCLVTATAHEIVRFSTNFPKTFEFSNSTGGKLSCKANGNPEPVTSWILSDGTPVGHVRGLRRVTQDGTLDFLPFKAEDYRQDIHSVTYRCAASTPSGTVVSNTVQVKGIVIQPFDVHVYDVYAMKGNSAIMKCHIPKFLENYVSVTAWVKDSVFEINSATNDYESKYIVLSNGDLLIRNVSLGDDITSFQCQINHRLTGQRKISQNFGRLIVTEPKSNIPPKISIIKDVMNIGEGTTIFLPCIAQGNPSPVSSWSMERNGKEVFELLSNHISYLHGSLLIQNIQSSDSGIYVCTATNPVGKDKMAIQINVAGPLSVEILPKEAKVNVGESVTFKCEISNQFINNIHWLKDGKFLPIEGIHQPNNHTIYIPQMQSSLAGIYQCFASNFFQSVYSIGLLQIGDSAPGIIQSFSEKTLNPNDPLYLECIAKGNPLPEFTWSINTEEIIKDNRIEIEHFDVGHEQIGSRISIRNVKREDGGVYRCSARNSLAKTHQQARINVYGEISVGRNLKIHATAEETIQIFCPFYGYPYKTITWRKGEIQLPKEARQAVFSNGTLQIKNTHKRRDAGKYICIVKNMNEKNFRAEVEIIVMVPPKISPFSFQDEQIREGTRARIQCVVSEGEAPLVVKWLKDGRPVPSELGVTIRHLDEFSSILMITAITPRHNGNYTASENPTVCFPRRPVLQRDEGLHSLCSEPGRFSHPLHLAQGWEATPSPFRSHYSSNRPTCQLFEH